jgi:hypothetical protein
VNYAKNLYHDEFIDFLPHIPSRALSRYSHGPSHCLYGFDLQENSFMPRHFSLNPHSHCGSHPPCRHGFSARGAYYHFEMSRFNGPRFSHHGSHPTHSNDEVHRTVMPSLGCMVKCWIPKIFLTNPKTETSIFSNSM